jgi:sulfatase maturation enzyme AslB (radical SAM superfamily)
MPRLGRDDTTVLTRRRPRRMEMQAIMSTPFDGSIAGFCRDALQISLRRSRSATFFAKTARNQRSAARRRVEAAGRGIPVPPLMILSLTRRCNLRCKGCFAQEQHRDAGGEMTLEQLRMLLSQARDLGVSIVALAGGEPLTRADVLEITKERGSSFR